MKLGIIALCAFLLGQNIFASKSFVLVNIDDIRNDQILSTSALKLTRSKDSTILESCDFIKATLVTKCLFYIGNEGGFTKKDIQALKKKLANRDAFNILLPIPFIIFTTYMGVRRGKLVHANQMAKTPRPSSMVVTETKFAQIGSATGLSLMVIKSVFYNTSGETLSLVRTLEKRKNFTLVDESKDLILAVDENIENTMDMLSRGFNLLEDE